MHNHPAVASVLSLPNHRRRARNLVIVALINRLSRCGVEPLGILATLRNAGKRVPIIVKDIHNVLSLVAKRRLGRLIRHRSIMHSYGTGRVLL